LSRFLGIGRADTGGTTPIGQKKRKTARSSRNRSSTGGFW
jgi:hypothetical protein